MKVQRLTRRDKDMEKGSPGLAKRSRTTFQRNIVFGAACALGIGCFQAQAFDADTLPPMGYHLGIVASWSAPYFADALAVGSKNWKDKASNVEIHQSGGQLSSLGLPIYLDSAQILTTTIDVSKTWQMPSTWPVRGEIFEGQVVLVWTGDADVRLTSGTFDSVNSTSAETGVESNGRRIYQLASNSKVTVEIHGLGTTALSGVHAWLPDPSDPFNTSLENQNFHPLLVEKINERGWGWIRFMDWVVANGSPQQDWVDRRLPGYVFQEGLLNERNPAEGVVNYVNGSGQDVYYTADRDTGAAFEYMVALCNETDTDMWITVPHLATDDFLDKLAKLIRYGSDGVNPYSSLQASPVWAPLNTNRNVYLEYSNEIWSSSDGFAQGGWSKGQAALLGIDYAEFNARRFSKVWEVFETYFDASRIVRVAAAFTAQAGAGGYTDRYLTEFYGNTALLKPEVLAVSTYFGNGIQNWANDQNFVPTSSTLWLDSYWTSAQLETDLDAMFDQWLRYVLGGLGYGGSTGFDQVEIQGGFDEELVGLAANYNLPLIAYEGGPSIYTDALDGGAAEDNGITLFMVEANRRLAFSDIYYTHMNQSLEKGLRANVGFQDVSSWGKYGQWGHLEYLGQANTNAPKWELLLAAFDEFSAIRSIHNPLGSVPQFDDPVALPNVEVGQAYDQTISASGGDGTLNIERIASWLPAGLSYDDVLDQITGTPNETGSSHIYLRVVDADGDPAWRTFQFNAYQRSTDPEELITFTNEVIGAVAEPYDVGDYRFTSTAGNKLEVQDETDAPWASTQWPNEVLLQTTWNQHMIIERVDGAPFDLYSLDLATHAGLSYQIIGTYADSGLIQTSGNIPTQRDPLTPVVLDFIGMIRVEVLFYELEDLAGGVRGGAVDNLLINHSPVVVVPPTTITFAGFPETDTVPEPFDIGEFRFTSSGGTDLEIQDDVYDPAQGAWPGGWPDELLYIGRWGQRHIVERVDGAPFNFQSVDLATWQAESCRIVGTYADSSTVEVIVNVPPQKSPLTPATLDFIGVVNVEFFWHKKVDGAGRKINGGIDNLVFN